MGTLADDMNDILAHHGVKGMHWGVRRSRTELSGRQVRKQARATAKAQRKSADVTTSHKPGRNVKTVGGQKLPAHQDAIKAAVTRQKAKASTTDVLSNEELKSLVDRLNLEQQYYRLSKGQKTEGQKFIEQELKKIGSQNAAKLATKHAAKVATAFA